mgnify:CR=1 FL=1
MIQWREGIVIIFMTNKLEDIKLLGFVLAVISTLATTVFAIISSVG